MSRTVALQRVADETREREQARQAFESADGVWRDAIRAALAAGCTRTEIAAEAGVTRQRVVQIDENRR